MFDIVIEVSMSTVIILVLLGIIFGLVTGFRLGRPRYFD